MPGPRQRASSWKIPRGNPVDDELAVASHMSPRSRKEVFQPHLPVRLPCYDLAPVTGITLARSSRSRSSGTPGFHGLTGGVYKARERLLFPLSSEYILLNNGLSGSLLVFYHILVAGQ